MKDYREIIKSTFNKVGSKLKSVIEMQRSASFNAVSMKQLIEISEYEVEQENYDASNEINKRINKLSNKSSVTQTRGGLDIPGRYALAIATEAGVPIATEKGLVILTD